MVLAAVVLWILRPWLHGLVMFVWTAPIVWLPPVAALAASAALARRAPRRVLWVFWVGAFVLFIVGAVLNRALVARSLYTHTRYAEIPTLPSDGAVRVLPKEVAEQIASSGFNSPTERLTDFHIVRTPQGLRWTALRTPDGFVRVFTKRSQGLVTLDAEQTARAVDQIDAELKYAPGMEITDNLRWRLLKKHYLIELGEVTGIVNGREPLIVVPYTEYRGWLVRRPVFGGVFVVHPSGRIEDLSPDEARRRPELVSSGRLFPESLARRIQDAYAYKRGIWNKWFIHEEQTQITDTEANRQPYLIDFGPGRGAKWVAVAEPHGRAFAARAVFLTDTVTGDTQLWKVPPGQSLTGNRRALETVRSVTIPGVDFAGDEQTGGDFKVVEPRPVFVNSRLVYLVSIVPENANSVSKTVIVDAARNKLVAIFDNDTDPQAEAKLQRYLATGELPEEDARGGAQPTEPAVPSQPSKPSSPTAPSGPIDQSELRQRLGRIIERQRELLREAEQLRRQLEEPPRP